MDKKKSCRSRKMSVTEFIGIPVAELVNEDQPSENIFRGRRTDKILRFPQEKLDFTLSLSQELPDSYSSALRPCHFNYHKNNCICDTRKTSKRDRTTYFKLDITFANYLHEMSHDYKYRIICDARLEDSKPQQICSFDEIRRSKSMIFFIDMNHQMDCLLNRLNGGWIYLKMDRFCMKAQSTLNKIQNDFKALLVNPEHSDVTLRVDNISIKAHKNILSCRSKVFQAMFKSEMEENETGIVHIADDFSLDVIREMLIYIYTGTSENMVKMPMDLYEAAVKYQLDDLKAECLESLIFQLNPENIFEISKLVERYNLSELAGQISVFMKKYKRVVRN